MRLMRPSTLLFLFLSPLLIWQYASAQEDAQKPSLCIGYRPDAELWHTLVTPTFIMPNQFCPKNYAMIAASKTLGSPRPGAHIYIHGDCCPLPEDALLDEHVFDDTRCPENTVATGIKAEARYLKDCAAGKKSCYHNLNSYRQLMRCTRINSEKYQLGEPKRMKSWALAAHFSSSMNEHYNWNLIPAGLRYGLSRKGRFAWAFDGCVAYPFGSIITAKTSKYCSGFFARELQYNGRGLEQPPAGTAVLNYHKCLAVNDLFDPNAKCISKETWPRAKK